MKKLLLFVSTLFCISAYSQTLPPDSFIVDGVYRNYTLHIPTGYSASQQYPLVLNLHGYTSSASEQMAYTQMNNVADTAKFLVVYPNGISKQWNSFGAGANDVKFLDSLIERIKASYTIDSKAIFSCGMSNGGFMSYTLACQLSHKIAAIASVTGTLSTSTQANCAISHKVPVLDIHGTQDPIVDYTLGVTGSVNVEATIAFWRDTNDCAQAPDTTNIPDISQTDNSTVQLIRYPNCAAGSEVCFYKITGGGHTWPGAPFDISTNIYGYTNHDITASIVIWEFFKRHKMGAVSTGIDDTKTELQTIVFPNPFDNQLAINRTDGKSFEASIFDIMGKQIFGAQSTTSLLHVDTHSWSSGLYVLKLKSETGSSAHTLCKP